LPEPVVVIRSVDEPEPSALELPEASSVVRYSSSSVTSPPESWTVYVVVECLDQVELPKPSPDALSIST